MRRLAIRQIEQHLIDIAPAPAFRRIVTLDDRMPGGVKVRGGVTVWRIVAATDMTTFETEAQMYPRVPDSQTILTAIRAGCNLSNLI